MEVTCLRCNEVHMLASDARGVVCACGEPLTGIFSRSAYQHSLDMIMTHIRTSTLSAFSSEELLDEVKRRIIEKKDTSTMKTYEVDGFIMGTVES